MMARLLGSCLLLLFSCAPAADLENARRFERAQEIFDEAEEPDDFLRAASLYQDILEDGIVSGVVLYNQGNAFLRAGERGRAVAAYRQARRYLPRDPRLEANLRLALGGAGTELDGTGVWHQVFFWQDRTSPREKALVTAALAALATSLGWGGWLLQRGGLARAAWIALAGALVMGLSSAWDWYRFERLESGVVVADAVVARKGNGESYQPAFQEPLVATTEFTVVEHRGDWIRLRIGEGLEGWIPQKAAVTYP